MEAGELLRQSHSTRDNFTGGEMYGKVLFEVLLNIVLLISMVGEAIRLAALVERGLAAGVEMVAEIAEATAIAARAQGTRIAEAASELAEALRVYSVARANEAVEAARALQAAASRQAASVVEAAQKAAQRAAETLQKATKSVQNAVAKLRRLGGKIKGSLGGDQSPLPKEGKDWEKLKREKGKPTGTPEENSSPSESKKSPSSGPGKFGKVPDTIKTSSGVDIHPTPGKTTTVLGRYGTDMSDIIGNQLDYPKTTDFGPKPDGYNVLNVPDDLAKTGDFWENYNKPFLDEAIKRGDPIDLATEPTSKVLYNESTQQLTGLDGK